MVLTKGGTVPEIVPVAAKCVAGLLANDVGAGIVRVIVVYLWDSNMAVLDTRNTAWGKMGHRILSVSEEESRDVMGKPLGERLCKGDIAGPWRFEEESLVHVEAQSLEVEHRHDGSRGAEGVPGDKHLPDCTVRSATQLRQGGDGVLLHVRPNLVEAKVHLATSAVVTVEVLQVLLPKLQIRGNVGRVIGPTDRHDAPIVWSPRNGQALRCGGVLQTCNKNERCVLREDLLVGDDMHSARSNVKTDLSTCWAIECQQIIKHFAI
mmetsp:Transcript_38859/g.121417  ORF Transcript_38859/g.121417 Transcript_38859/m.121417 type:complete len:264 (-) Transcript_38859:427-1218(-)